MTDVIDMIKKNADKILKRNNLEEDYYDFTD
jgi:hypothetical protein